MLNVSELVSECCGETSTSTLQLIDEGAWGYCSGCSYIAYFEDPDLWTDLDDEEISMLPSRINGTSAIEALANIPERDWLNRMYGGIDNTPRFSPATISWITDNIAVTSREGAEQARRDGHFIINTAAELSTKAHVKIPIFFHTEDVPVGYSGPNTNVRQFKAIQAVMESVLANPGQKVVVHCAMGMERSVTSVVWYLAHTTDMTLQESLALVQSKREIAQDRLWLLEI